MIRLALGTAALTAWAGITVARFFLDGIEALLTDDGTSGRWDG